MRDNIYQRGASLVFALFLMCFLTIVSFSLIWLIRDESKSTTKLYISQRALYAAEAGIERKIAELKEENSSDIALTTLNESQYVVTVNSAGTDRYEITSTGYAPSLADPKERRKLSVVVLVNPAVPEHAIAVGGTSDFAGSSTIYGTIRTSGKVVIGNTCRITESSAGQGDASIYSSYNSAGPDDWPVITFGNNFQISIAGQYIKCRADSSLAPDTHAKGADADDATSPIRPESNIVDNCTIVENDNSSDTDPVSLPSADLDAIIADSVEVTTSNYKTVLNGAPVNTPWKLYGADDKVIGEAPASSSQSGDPDVKFCLTNASNWDPAGVNYNFVRGVRFRSSAEVGEGDGSIIVSSGTGSYGIQSDSNLGSSAGDEVRLNFIVYGGSWTVADIFFNSNIDLQGYVYGAADVAGESNVHIIGIVEVGGDADFATNVTITHSSDIPMDIPWEEGTSGEVNIVSWQEVNP